MIDSLKGSVLTALQGAGGIVLSLWEVLPDILRVAILVATLTHIIVRIKKDIK